MIELVIVCEGPTEEAFIKVVLAPHLDALGVCTTATVVTTSLNERTGMRAKGGGGWKSWLQHFKTLLRRKDHHFRVSTLFDLYRLPGDLPERDGLSSIGDTNVRAEQAEGVMEKEVGDPRFIPYLQRHEFETFVLAGLGDLKSLIDRPQYVANLDALQSQIGDFGPEDIDDGPSTNPAARLVAAVPEYAKAFHGPLVTQLIGIERLRAACPRFSRWVSRLESLASEQEGGTSTSDPSTNDPWTP